MRVSLQLDGVLSRGTEQVPQPMVWPAYFTVDDRALGHLTGDPYAADFVHAPGPQQPEGALSWQRDLQAAMVPREQALVGLGLMYTAGGADLDATWSAYQDMVRRVRAVALREAVRAAGLGPLLVGFGAAWQPAWLDESEHARMRQQLSRGFDPQDLSLDDEPALLDGLGAFATLADVMRQRLSPAPVGAAPERDVTLERSGFAAGLRLRDLDLSAIRTRLQSVVQPPPAPPAMPPTPQPPLRVPLPPLRPGPFRPPGPIHPGPLNPGPVAPAPPAPTLAQLAPGTVVAMTVQAWNAQALDAGAPTVLDRALPARNTLRASLTLSGRLTREP